ncbi:hypothetical protein A2531_01775 [Candidatus Falkowbacteria bacterium RIFOXYD2_FULL_34_120]|uniref:Uncharacterized protein n=2 Tax=Candidatus Falkowiibacteriota TaxID=1752728 RepID=A0A1F5TLV3_9BACT|nr:MAG: hypothetical protein A2227_07205 [Candidatus Falkowbacteria bacterium RIFOXYA2_FULL_47_19]OGF29179.1 MAG: hypothetical protein A2500_05855 [Candidatus Falkowbacteria bacterium RIFOXYC12_FULL_34_55]OGF38701.1 MAG: hypothetical protein A2515_01520 [Candidatus Falkowbacteria bacterium RIFOXYD12_FULL_34_57]OGF39935.1 MAG: hypothetical protein A2531_01775 [Candidatus Falkowbacteria bacterium RIFOXYD2_FULL_34_120]
MINKMTSALSKGKTAVLAFVLALVGGLLSFGGSALAAVDPSVSSTTGMVVDTMKENVTGVITANIANIVIVGVIIFSIGFVWKLARRFMK